MQTGTVESHFTNTFLIQVFVPTIAVFCPNKRSQTLYIFSYVSLHYMSTLVSTVNSQDGRLSKTDTCISHTGFVAPNVSKFHKFVCNWALFNTDAARAKMDS